MMMRGFLGLAGAALLAGCSVGQDVPLAERGAMHFHEMLGRGEIAGIVAAAGPELSAPPAKARFVQLLEAVHRKLGAMKSTKQVGWNDQITTGGHFISLDYRTRYDKGEASENLVFRITEPKAVLAGYHINSDALILG